MRRRALAMAIATTGASVGGIIHPIMLNHLFHGSAGFHVGVRASAGLNLCLTGIGVLLSQPRLPPKRDDSKLLSQLWTFSKDMRYVCAISGWDVFLLSPMIIAQGRHRAFLALFGTLFVFFYLQLDVVSKGIDSNLAFSNVIYFPLCSCFRFVLMSVYRLQSWMAQAQWADYVRVTSPLSLVYSIWLSAVWRHRVYLSSACLQSKTPPDLYLSVYCSACRLEHVGCPFLLTFKVSSFQDISLIGPMLAVLSRDVNEIGARVGFCFSITGACFILRIMLLIH